MSFSIVAFKDLFEYLWPPQSLEVLDRLELEHTGCCESHGLSAGTQPRFAGRGVTALKSLVIFPQKQKKKKGSRANEVLLELGVRLETAEVLGSTLINRKTCLSSMALVEPTLKIRILQSDWGHHAGSEALKDSRM